jgi:hypothetical protein
MQNFFKNNLKRFTVLSVLAMSLAGMIFIKCSGPALEASSDLEKGFLNPPGSAKPRVWWHWMNGNITKEGIRADLEWMKRANIGGFQNFDAALSTPQVVKKRLIYMTPEWKEAFLFTAKLADSLDLRRFSGMERERRSLGVSCPGNEEICLERDSGRRGKAL